jgi:hypothetical protein
MLKLSALYLLLAVLLISCATPPAQAPTATEMPAVIETPPPPQATGIPDSELPAEAVILYSRRGGIAGRDEVWAIYPDGSVAHPVNPGGEAPEMSYQVDPAQVSRLLDRLDELGFFEMRGEYLPQDTCCDRITYKIEARSGRQVNRVITLDAAPGAPAELWQAIEALNAFIGQF